MKSYNQSITSLYEGHYYLGVGALINSLVAAGYQGRVDIGYRGQLPAWTNQLKRGADGHFLLNEDIGVFFHEIAPGRHLTFEKPYFVQQLFLSNPELEDIFYFDPDIVVNAPWRFYSDWVKKGICLCLDNCYAIVPSSHPWRHDWLQLGQKEMNEKIPDYFVNAGFFGVTRKDKAVLDRWTELTDHFQQQGGDITQFTRGAYKAYKSDQDILNAVLTCYPELRYSIIGTEGMGFSQPAYLMSHAVGGAQKPWVKNCLSELLRDGKKLSYNERRFFDNCRQPLQLFTSGQYKMKMLNVKLTNILGRLIGQ